MPRRPNSDRTVLLLHSSYGGSARATSEALAVSLKVQQGIEVRAVDFLETCMPAMSVLARFAYRQTPDFFFGATGTLPGIVADGQGGALLDDVRSRGVDALARIVAEAAPAAVVSTCPVAAGVAAEVIASVADCVCASVLNDHTARFQWIHPRIDLFFVPSRESRDDLVVHGAPYDRVVVTGAPIHPRAAVAKDRASCLEDLALGDRFTVAVAGSGALSEEGDITSVLVRSALQVLALVAENSRARDRARRATASGGGFVVSVEELHRYGIALGAANVLVCAPGSPRIPEALAAGVPLILYNPVPERELDNTDFLVNSGAALLARDEADVAEKCRFLAGHPERHAQLAGASADLGRPRAAQAIVERLLAAV